MDQLLIRYPRGGDSNIDITPIKEINYGKWEKINSGEKITIIASGKMLQHTLLAKELLLKEGINPTIINATFIKPLDVEILKEVVASDNTVVTIEDNVTSGGFGSYVLNEAL